jgi:2-polyprenyl-6-methoxyphenol hydroxylase-like FAD-dependent oxidoreductase
MDIPVLICGGGPVGLAVAVELGWQGVPCLLVEQGDGQRVQPKMLTTSVRTVELCRRWGIADRLKTWGLPDDFPFDNVFVTSLGGYELARLPKPAPREIKPLPTSPENERHCPQTWFDPILRETAAAFPCVTLRHRTRLERFEDRGEHVEATLVDVDSGRQEVVRAGYLVGCDGGRSVVRDVLGIGVSGRGVIDRSVNLLIRAPGLATYHDKGNAGRYAIVGEIGTWATFVAVDGRELWRITLYGKPDFDPYAADYDECIRRTLGRDIPYELLSAERWTRRAQWADSFAKGRVVLAGDAVHAMPPNGGFGMNTGIADAVNLGWKLAARHHGWGGARLLETYEIERKPVGMRTVGEALRDFDRLTSDTRFPGIADDTPAGAALRARLGERLQAANKKAWEPVGIHLGYRYDTSPIVISDGTPTPADDEMNYVPTARPGSRAPHVWLEDGRSTLDLFGRNFTLLDLGADPDAIQALRAAAADRNMPLEVIALTQPAVRAAYEKALVLVRPDGHVAWRGDALDRDASQLIDTVRGALRA